MRLRIVIATVCLFVCRMPDSGAPGDATRLPASVGAGDISSC